MWRYGGPGSRPIVVSTRSAGAGPEDPELGLPVAFVDEEPPRQDVQRACGRLSGVDDAAVGPSSGRGSLGDRRRRGRGTRGDVDDDGLLQQHREYDDERRDEHEDADAEQDHDARRQAAGRLGRRGSFRRDACGGGRGQRRRRRLRDGGRRRGRRRCRRLRDGGRGRGRLARRRQRRQRGKRGDRCLRAGLGRHQDGGDGRRE